MDEQQALREQLSVLTEELAALRRSTPRPNTWDEAHAVQIVPDLPTTVPLHTLVRTEGLPDDARGFRQVLEAVALGYGVAAPVKDVPNAWVPLLRAVHKVRIEGGTWARALTQAGLVPPPDPEAHLPELRAELEGLYERVPTIIDQVNKRAASSVTRQKMLQKIGQLLM